MVYFYRYICIGGLRLKTFLPFFKGKRIQTFLAPLLKMAEATFELIVPIIVAQIIDNGIPHADTTYIVTRCLILVGLGAAGFGFSVVSQYMSAAVATHFSSSLRLALFRKVNSLSFSAVDEAGTASVVMRMTGDVDRLQTGINMTLRLLLRAPFIVFGAMIAAFLVEAVSATVFAVAIPVLLVIVFAILLCGVRLYNRSQKGLEDLTVLTEENVTGVRVLRAFARENSEVEHFKKQNDVYTKAQLTAGRLSSLLNPLTYTVINVAIICLLYIGAIRVDSGSLTKGQVVALYNYLSQILVELVKLANLVITVSKALAGGKRVATLLNMEDKQVFPTEPVSEPITEEAVRFENVSLSYNGTGEALSHISFTLRKGETLGILGGTGSGKSSLVSLIPRFYDATEGTVLVNGINVNEYPKKQLRDKIAVVMQKPFLLPGTIKDNICFDHPDEEKLDLALSLSQSADVVQSKEKGVDEEIRKGGSNFSGGQKQRLSVARALYKDADILILDDAASALDNVTERKLRESIASLHKTVILVSQRVMGLAHADKILVLDEGKAIAFGTHEELLATCPLYLETYRLQTSGGGAL